MNDNERDVLMGRLCVKMDNVQEDISEIKQCLVSRPCPSVMCRDHHTDIVKLKYRNQIMAWGFGSALLIVGLCISALALLGC